MQRRLLLSDGNEKNGVSLLGTITHRSNDTESANLDIAGAKVRFEF